MDLQEQLQIDRELANARHWYANRTKSATSCKDVLQYLVDNHPTNKPEGGKIWFWAWEVIGKVNSKGKYLSHRSPARLSDLAIKTPDLVEHKRIGRFKIYRVRRENREKVIEYLK